MNYQTDVMEDTLTIKAKASGNGVTAKASRVSDLDKPSTTTLSEDVAVEEVKALIEAKLQAAYEKALQSPQAEVAEPLGWWDLVGIGPFQPGANLFDLPNRPPAPYLPHQVIRIGETAYVATVLYVPSVSVFGLPYEIKYSTGNLETWNLGPANLNVTHRGHLNPNSPFVVDILRFRAQVEGCYEMNICARIFGCPVGNRPNTAPPFAGFARRVYDFDREMFIPRIPRLPGGANVPAPPTSGPQGWQVYDTGIRFQIYE
jgi:hypothetical protein